MSIMDTLPETNSSYLKMDGWKMVPFLLGFAQFSGYKLAVSFRECNNPIVGVYIYPIIPIKGGMLLYTHYTYPIPSMGLVYLPTIFG